MSTENEGPRVKPSWCPQCGAKAVSPMKRLELMGEHHCDLCGQAFRIENIPSPVYDQLIEEAESVEGKPGSVGEDSAPSSSSDPSFDEKRKRRGKS
jgi:transcription elongation factor Elf1